MQEIEKHIPIAIKNRNGKFVNPFISEEAKKIVIDAIKEGLSSKKNYPISDDDDSILSDEEIEWELMQEAKAKQAGMTREQIINGEHYNIEF